MIRIFAFFLLILQLAHPLMARADGDDPLADWGLHETTGAAAGYVADSACGECHADKAASYAEMGMAKSFRRASGAPVIEEFTGLPFYHAPTGRYYEATRQGDDYVFRRFRLAPDGTQIDVFERKADWILGSGHHVRTFLYQTADGALFEFPLAWYTQGGYWQMNPGFEFANQQGMQRQIRRRCMACHNALPEVARNSDRAGRPELFPHDLPHGLGCQRCHGPGADHVRRALSGADDIATLRAAIVNPGTLPNDRLYSICYGCHMQPTVSVNAPLRGGRGIYSFRPGQDVNDYLTHIDITDALRPRAERFEINHHPYRLEQSACFRESQGKLGCLTCHDPHVKIKPPQRAAHYRRACLGCHEVDENDAPRMTGGAAHPPLAPGDDCTTCHMPERRTQDVIHVTMTDHKITRDPGDLAALIAPIPKQPPEISGVELLRPGSLSDDERVIQQVMAIFSTTGRKADYAADALERVLLRTGWPDPGPWLELAKSQQVLGRFDKALAAADQTLARDPDNPEAVGLRALALYRQGNLPDALHEMDRAVALAPDFAKLHFNHAVLLAAAGRLDEARAAATRVLELRDNHWPAHRLLGRIAENSGDNATAIRAYLDALVDEPKADDARARLVNLLEAEGRAEEAARHAE